MRSAVKILLLVIGLFGVMLMLVLGCAKQPITEPVQLNLGQTTETEWTRAYAASKNPDKFVQLIVHDVVETNDSVEVFLVTTVEGRKNVFVMLGRASFFPLGVGKMTMGFDLGQVLMHLPAAPDATSRIVVKDKSNHDVKYSRYEIRYMKSE
jgi:hypothetical protein